MIPVIVYRVYADGRPDELVRGADIVGTPLASFSKILATGDKPEVFNGYCGAESGSVPVSAVSPAILVSEIEIEKKAKSNDRPPLLPEPTSLEARREAQVRTLVIWRRLGGTALALSWSQQARLAPATIRVPGDARRDRALAADVAAEPGAAVFRPVRDRRRRRTSVVTASLGGVAFAAARRVARRPRSASASAITNSTTRTIAAAASTSARATTWSGFPLEADTIILRRYFWLLTDSAYKSAVEAHFAQTRRAAQYHAEREAQRFRARGAGEAHAPALHSSPSIRRSGPNACAPSRPCSRDIPK